MGLPNEDVLCPKRFQKDPKGAFEEFASTVGQVTVVFELKELMSIDFCIAIQILNIRPKIRETRPTSQRFDELRWENSQ